MNTTAVANFSDLRLQRGDYEVINTVMAEAAIIYIPQNNGYKIIGTDENFELSYKIVKKLGWECKHSGVLQLGYLGNDYVSVTSRLYSPEDVARGLAIYRAINDATQQGGDGLIEPIVSTSVQQNGKSITFVSRVSAKVIRLKTNGEL